MEWIRVWTGPNRASRKCSVDSCVCVCVGVCVCGSGCGSGNCASFLNPNLALKSHAVAATVCVSVCVSVCVGYKEPAANFKLDWKIFHLKSKFTENRRERTNPKQTPREFEFSLWERFLDL